MNSLRAFMGLQTGENLLRFHYHDMNYAAASLVYFKEGLGGGNLPLMTAFCIDERKFTRSMACLRIIL